MKQQLPRALWHRPRHGLLCNCVVHFAVGVTTVDGYELVLDTRVRVGELLRHSPWLPRLEVD